MKNLLVLLCLCFLLFGCDKEDEQNNEILFQVELDESYIFQENKPPLYFLYPTWDLSLPNVEVTVHFVNIQSKEDQTIFVKYLNLYEGIYLNLKPGFYDLYVTYPEKYQSKNSLSVFPKIDKKKIEVTKMTKKLSYPIKKSSNKVILVECKDIDQPMIREVNSDEFVKMPHVYFDEEIYFNYNGYGKKWFYMYIDPNIDYDLKGVDYYGKICMKKVEKLKKSERLKFIYELIQLN